jgi:hypothetical protein
MSNDLSHLLVKLLCNGFAARPSSTPPCGSRLEPAAGCFRKCKSSIPSGFSQGNAASRPKQGSIVMKMRGRSGTEVALDAPAVALGMFERALHLFPQNFGEDGASHGARAGLGDVGGPVTAGQHSLQ